MKIQNAYLVLVGRVEGDLADLPVPPSKTDDVTGREFDALQERRLGRVSDGLFLEDRDQRGVVLGSELGVVAERGAPLEFGPTLNGGEDRDSAQRLILGRVDFVDLEIRFYYWLKLFNLIQS